VRALLDENLPRDLVPALAGHEVVTVQGLGWSGLQNGELLRRAAGHVDALITMDSNLVFQQRLEGLPFGVVVIHARSNRMADLLPITDSVLAALAGLLPGVVRHVGA
jgi:predicted nuclease of predicted toxin-antitoxin system